jgi:hypothetical protein
MYGVSPPLSPCLLIAHHRLLIATATMTAAHINVFHKAHCPLICAPPIALSQRLTHISVAPCQIILWCVRLFLYYL